MKTSPLKLLRDREGFWRAMRAGELGWRELAGLAAFVVVACALYGVVLAGSRSPRLSLYVAIKLPALFLGTMGFVAAFNWMAATLLGAGLSFRSTLLLVFAAMAIGCWILLALAPVAAFFLLAVIPESGTHEALQYAHNAILVTHIAILAAAGLAGNAALAGGLRRIVRPGCRVEALFPIWIASFAFVGCQLSWILRPFVCSPFYPVAFMRPDCLSRNFYEFVFTEVLPFLATGAR